MECFAAFIQCIKQLVWNVDGMYMTGRIHCIRECLFVNNLWAGFGVSTVEQQIFACRNFSRFTWISGIFRAHFLQANCLRSKIAKISCRENLLFYSIWKAVHNRDKNDVMSKVRASVQTVCRMGFPEPFDLILIVPKSSFCFTVSAAFRIKHIN